MHTTRADNLAAADRFLTSTASGLSGAIVTWIRPGPPELAVLFADVPFSGHTRTLWAAAPDANVSGEEDALVLANGWRVGLGG